MGFDCSDEFKHRKKEKLKKMELNQAKPEDVEPTSCSHEWDIESYDQEPEYAYESGNQWLIDPGGHFVKYTCKLCGKEELSKSNN